MAESSRITMSRAEDVALVFTMSPVVDVTGWGIRFRMAKTLGQTVSVEKTASITSGTDGIFTVTIASADTSALTVGEYEWEARRTDSGNNAVLADGTLRLRQDA